MEMYLDWTVLERTLPVKPDVTAKGVFLVSTSLLRITVIVQVITHEDASLTRLGQGVLIRQVLCQIGEFIDGFWR